MIALPTKDGYAHFACPTCGNVYMLPWSDSYSGPPWCHHGGTTGYAWPETHWQGGEESYPDWRERWTGHGWIETIRCEVHVEPTTT